MTRSVALYGGVLALLLGASWVRWTADPEVDLAGKVVLLQGQEDRLEQVVWTSEKDKAVIERKADDRGDYLWVRYTRWTPKPRAEDPDLKPGEDAAVADASPADDVTPAEGASPVDVATDESTQPEERVEKVQLFKAGENGEKLFKSFSPLLAIRKLDLTTPEQIKNAGLDAPTESIDVVRKGRKTHLDVGGEVYGTRDRYVRDAGTGEIFLVSSETLRPLRYARTRLPDRTLWSFDKKAIASVAISNAQGDTVEAEQKNPDDPQQAAWVLASAPDEAAEQLNTWMGKALRLKGTEYADPDAPPDDLQPRFKLLLRDTKGTTETLEVLQQGEDGVWWGRSEHTRGLVKLLHGPTSSLAEDVDALVGA